jgi:hypothetical protein
VYLRRRGIGTSQVFRGIASNITLFERAFDFSIDGLWASSPGFVCDGHTGFPFRNRFLWQRHLAGRVQLTPGFGNQSLDFAIRHLWTGLP